MCRVRQSNEDLPQKFKSVSVYSCDGHLERYHCLVTTHSMRSRLISNIQTVTVYGSKYTHYSQSPPSRFRPSGWPWLIVTTGGSTGPGCCGGQQLHKSHSSASRSELRTTVAAPLQL